VALRERPAPASRFGPTDQTGMPPACDAPIRVGVGPDLELEIGASVDGHPIGELSIVGQRNGGDFRWTGTIALADGSTATYAAARIAGDGWHRTQGGRWHRVDAASVRRETLDAQVLAVALLAPNRQAAEDAGIAIIEGARARQCRIRVNGPTFRRSFPQIWHLVGDAALSRWRGELDYWVFMDGQLGLVSATAEGDALGMGKEGLQGLIRVTLSATDRDRRVPIETPNGRGER
jgi:hypothetical protein